MGDTEEKGAVRLLYCINVYFCINVYYLMTLRLSGL
ncbi:Uncharacterised protein [Salmonella enterica]|nr:Uncharacterised protein [Salmonella enterica]